MGRLLGLSVVNCLLLFYLPFSQGASLGRERIKRTPLAADSLSPKLQAILELLEARKDANALDYILETNRGLGLNLYEGDIKDFNPRHRNALRNKYALWSARTVPYVIDDSIDREVLGFINEAIEEYHNKTCIRWTPRSQERDYVVFKKRIGCYSTIGRLGNAQEVSLGKPCAKKGTAMHEMLHVLGFFHEHSRPDRDPWVQILLNNVEAGKESNFDRLSVDKIDTLGVEYDYGSIMHYSRYAFSANGQPTLLPKQDPFASLGQRTAFSEKDLEKINRLYGCDLIPPEVTSASTTGWTPWGSWSDCDLQCRQFRHRRFCTNLNSSFCPGDQQQVGTCAPPCKPAVSLGCWANEPSSSAIPSVEGLYPGVTGDYRSRPAAIRRCADVATSQGYLVFALLDGGQCLTGPQAQATFNTYGPSSACGQQGKGTGAVAMNVYSFSTDMDGGWGAWTVWGQCSSSCGGGKQYRYRRCNSPPPIGNGRQCQGHDAEAWDCNTDRCQTRSRCGVRYHVGTAGNSGFINVQNYDNYMTCEYVIKSSQNNETVSLVVRRMDIEPSQGCIYDALTIYDGEDDVTGQQLGTFCGTGPLPRLQSSGHALFVRFQSDATTTGGGYTIRFSINDLSRKACVEVRAPRHGTFTGNNFVGDTVVFSCNHGYHLVGQSSVECVDQPGMAAWTHSFPVCMLGRRKRGTFDISLVCTFEGDLCGFRHINHTRWHWRLKKNDNPVQGAAIHADDTTRQIVQGFHLHVESSRNWLPYDSARVTSQMYSTDGLTPHCMTFWYRLLGNDLSKLHVLRVPKDDWSGDVTWSVSGDSGSVWRRGQVDLPPDNTVQVALEAELGQYMGSSASVDSLVISPGSCS